MVIELAHLYQAADGCVWRRTWSTNRSTKQWDAMPLHRTSPAHMCCHQRVRLVRCLHEFTLRFSYPCIRRYNDSLYPNTWEIWPSPELVFGNRGVVTDDTSQRIGLLHPWLSSVDDSADLTEQHYRSWMNATARHLYNETLHEPGDWYGLRRRWCPCHRCP